MTLTRGFIRNAATTPLDARLADMALIVPNADGSPRVGVLGGNPTTITTGATMSVAISAGEFVTSKGKSDGVAIFTNDGTVNLAIAAAPASNSRIDTIWVKHEDNTTGDAASLPIFGVTAGVAAASPVKAAIPTGALELATLRIYSGTTATNGGANALTYTYQMTAARGGTVPFRTKAELDLWTNPSPGQQATTLDTGTTYEWFGGIWRAQSGTRLLIPSGVTNATIAADGAIKPNQGALNVRVDGVFSSKYRTYRIEWALSFTAAGSSTLQLSAGGVPYGGANYNEQRLVSSSGSTSSSSQANAGNWPGAGVAGTYLIGHWVIKNPAHVSPKYLELDAMIAPGQGFAIDRGWLGSVDSTIFDGFYFTTANAINAGDTSFFKVYGMA